MFDMNPSSLDIDFSAVQSQKDMYKWFDSELIEEGLAEPPLKIFMG